MTTIRQAVAAGDAAALRRAAHALKGSMLFLGAGRPSERARALETMATGGDLSRAGDALASLEEQMASVMTSLSGFASGARPATR
jgi:HPt (histidine-containing phosphotransfer) domain-containing protein